MAPERAAYKKAIAAKDWAEAVRLRAEFPETLSRPPADVPEEIAAIATDPLEPGYMVVEWTVRKNACKTGCRPYALQAHASQFDHKPPDTTPEELKTWLQSYVENRREHLTPKQLGQTLYLLHVEEIVRISDFDGNAIEGD